MRPSAYRFWNDPTRASADRWANSPDEVGGSLACGPCDDQRRRGLAGGVIRSPHMSNAEREGIAVGCPGKPFESFEYRSVLECGLRPEHPPGLGRVRSARRGGHVADSRDVETHGDYGDVEGWIETLASLGRDLDEPPPVEIRP